MRHVFISDLVKELLGPRNGATEKFKTNIDDPRSEYTTGQLEPPKASLNEKDIDNEDGLGEGTASAEEDNEDQVAGLLNQAFIGSGENFRRVPSSMGISFAMNEMPQDGDFDVCVTWARYVKNEEEWVRNPSFWIVKFKTASLQEGVVSEDKTLSLSYYITKLATGESKISIYLSSLIKKEDAEFTQTEEIIFQPEIRVVLKNKNSLIELGDLSFFTDDPEWRISTRQYDRFKIFARGHLCGAYWKDIDPQRPYEEKIKLNPDLPFKWIDGLHFLSTNPQLGPFIYSDLRTDFIPLYSSPEADSGLKLELYADLIASCENFEALKNILEPIIIEYENWVNQIKDDAATKEIDGEIIRRHKEAIDRVKKGLLFINKDKDAFLSFLFMNKVMAKQYSWGRQEDKKMRWRPFQLVFILLALESTVNKDSSEREICDTIWFPTGGGKTEAYLGLAAFALAYRRRTSDTESDGSKSGEGTCVISRYTLRLLTIQQFRRASKMIMACEILRCETSKSDFIGWMPKSYANQTGFVWGRTPFSIGLWVGGGVTPNGMEGAGFKDIPPGAIHLLNKPAQDDGPDPAQIINCPCCNSVLSFPSDGISSGSLTLKLITNKKPIGVDLENSISNDNFKVSKISFTPHISNVCGYLKIDMVLTSPAKALDIHEWWVNVAGPTLGVQLLSFNASRPGYFGIQGGLHGKITDYEIRCPDQTCEINAEFYKFKQPGTGRDWEYSLTHPSFSLPRDPHTSKGLCISAETVDEKLYSYPPSLLISTVDKLAGMAFTNESAALFGRVRTFSSKNGFSQENSSKIKVLQFQTPWLIIQDELHLLDGPLGSSFGLFETAIEALCDKPKYIASSATIRNSLEQVNCLMGRKSKVFPPVNVDVGDGFFLKLKEEHPLKEDKPGRLFMGLAFPGRAPQRPTARVWGRLLQTAQDQLKIVEEISDEKVKADTLSVLDNYWTLIGYFNAVRELAQAETLYRQDMPNYLDRLMRQNPNSIKRDLDSSKFRNLSSQTRSSDLPGYLSKMELTINHVDSLTAVASTSMFGTGVDISRLSLMVVHGQPKSASQYIQAVGRIGRERAGLAVVFFRVSKPRDLNHYEYFTGYHRKLAVAVEPITVKPLAPKALDRTIGPLLAVLLRNWNLSKPEVPKDIDLDVNGGLVTMLNSEILNKFQEIFNRKWDQQTPERRPYPDKKQFLNFIISQIQRWQEFARRQTEKGNVLKYKPDNKAEIVVLGSDNSNSAVFTNVPRSLREVEPMINLSVSK